jgi:hypothetical protein
VARNDAPSVLCPSARLKEGAILVGIVNAEGQVTFLPDRLVVNRGFIDNAQQGRSPEKRFRFADTCVKSACRQWSEDRCGVVEQVLGVVSSDQLSEDLPDCSIRSQCRWYLQRKADACWSCSFVITDCLDES